MTNHPHSPDPGGEARPQPRTRFEARLAELGTGLLAPFHSARPWKELLVTFKDDVQQQLSSLFSLVLLGGYLLFTLVMTLPYVGLSGLVARELAKKNGSGAAAAGLQFGVSQGMAQAFTQISGSASEGLAMAAVP
ncbi:MAG: hypothetical protein FJ125_15960, partial [Deltaproteobacteria bacterium]|nr:hypothetical protein [Deltaproteobacteria bacterium]